MEDLLLFYLFRCGMVALAMAMNITVEDLMEKAKELLYTIQGELFDGNENLSFAELSCSNFSSYNSKSMPTIQSNRYYSSLDQYHRSY